MRSVLVVLRLSMCDLLEAVSDRTCFGVSGGDLGNTAREMVISEYYRVRSSPT